jgi:hypothetical protein
MYSENHTMYGGSPGQTIMKDRVPSKPKSAMARRHIMCTKHIAAPDPYSELADRFYGKTGGFNI